jgi:hypothetical protein
VATEDRELDLAAALGAEREASTQILSLYIPNKTAMAGRSGLHRGFEKRKRS